MGRSKGGLTSKVHMLTDAHGNPKSFEVTEGNAHDLRMAESLSARSADIVIADKGYDSKPLRDALLGSGKIPIIPSRKCSMSANPHFDKEIYKARHAIENLFAKMKQYRAFATRFDKLKRNYVAATSLVCFMVWTQ
ncbi:MAG TPA: IS5 family transposase [Oligoflexus sp.]|uniref:IS5 family transposase n=1 Tax=Oligoflexus sp. TaxID=1971216 RepID=UPI002D4C128F|nr:IS5 family transposase [Oligoflexus sp.]HYX37569.1 IS5 family transposase [Oligoflexus sp.]